jgi:hypothetical protein
VTVLHASTTKHEWWGGPKRYIRIVVHETTPALQRAAARYRGTDFSNAAGCFHPAPERERFHNGEWTSVTDPHWAGVLRVSKEWLDTEVVIHECLHAALAIYRMDVSTFVRLENGCGEREETLAYIAGDLTANVS